MKKSLNETFMWSGLSMQTVITLELVPRYCHENELNINHSVSIYYFASTI